jgi:hypothetical protein
MAFKRFNPADDIVENQKTTISSGLWSGGSATLTSFFTQSANGNITGSFLELYNEDPNLSSSAESQFSVGYAHIDGSGSAGNTTKLTTGARQREKIDPGNWELTLGQVSSAGRTTALTLIDDSGATTNPTVNQGGRVFNVVEGSISSGITTAAASEKNGSYGLFYPDLGLILLNATKAETSGGLGVQARSSDTFDNRPKAFFNALVSGSSFQARREEEISSTNFFVRVNNKDFNFSANPTFSTGSDGSLTQASFFKDPKTFITQVGLYNDENELLAIAKLSKPILKSYSREAIIKVKLDF